MSGAQIKDLVEGQQIEGVFLLSASQVLVTKTGKPYGSLRLSDQSGDIETRLWDDAERQLEGLAPGAVVRAVGRVESFKGARQVILRSIQAEPGTDPALFIAGQPGAL